MKKLFSSVFSLLVLLSVFSFTACEPEVSVTAHVLSSGWNQKITVGASYTLREGVDYKLSGPAALDFKSSSTSVATVDSSGRIVGKSSGTAKITMYVSGSGSSVSWIVTVVSLSGTITSVILPTTKTVYVGDIFELAAEVTGTSNYTDVSWTSSNDKVVSITSKNATSCGLKALAIGTATITATSLHNSAKYATCLVTVEAGGIKPTEIVLNKTAETLLVGGETTLTATISPSDTTYPDIIWTANPASKVEINQNGTSCTVRAKSAGEVEIKATSSQFATVYATCKITISNIAIKLDQKSATLTVGEETTLTATIEPANATGTSILWLASPLTSVDLTPNGNSCKVTAKVPGTVTIKAFSSDADGVYDTCSVKINSLAAANANQFFWGTWIRMDKGTEIEIEEDKVKDGTNNYLVAIGSDDSKLVLENGKTFEKKSNAVIQTQDGDATVPYFRKGGTDLKYSLKLVGFDDSRSNMRAAGLQLGKAGLIVKSISNRFSSFSDKKTSDSEGKVELKAPIQGDTQTVKVELANNKEITVENLTVENNGDDLGTIPIVEDNDYSLKITGTIAKDKKDDGYLYAGKTYPIELTITNISEVSSEPSIVEITVPNNMATLSNPQVVFKNGTTMDMDKEGNKYFFTLPTLKPHVTCAAKFNITFANESAFTTSYTDMKVNIDIKNAFTDRTWVDYVPLRVFKKQVPFSFYATSAMGNSNASLNGFLIYPDGNSQFFTSQCGQGKTIKAPLFKDDENYILVFSGATTTGSLENTTETYYTVALNSEKYKTYVSSSDGNLAAMRFGEGSGNGNDIEDNAYEVTGDFTAYLRERDIDYYKFQINSNVVNPSNPTVNQLTDITLESSVSGDDVVFTATAGFDSYEWSLNGTVQTAATTNVFTVAKTALLAGVNEITVYAKKGTDFTEWRFKQINYTSN